MKAARTVIADVAHSIEPLYPPRVWEELGTAFFATFWCLESGDLVFPSAAYQRQRHILRSQLDAIEQNSDLVSAPSQPSSIAQLRHSCPISLCVRPEFRQETP